MRVRNILNNKADQVIVHEVETRQPLDYFLHEEPVYGVSVHPLNANIFVTACSDGRLLLYDMRQDGHDFCLVHNFPSASSNGVSYEDAVKLWQMC